MVRSMTAFARVEQHTNWGGFYWEARAVNHRHLEILPRLPDELRALEPRVREIAARYLRRGKLELTLRWQGQSQMQPITVQTDAVRALLDALREINRLTGGQELPPAWVIAQWPGVLQTPAQDWDSQHATLLAALETTLAQLLEHRSREGAQLLEFIEQRLTSVEDETAKVHTQLPAILAAWRERLHARLAEVQQTLDPNRLEQEMVLIAQRMDVQEELARLQAHVHETRTTLQSQDPMGRRLDFLMQEMYREANTLGAKSLHASTSLASVNLKVLIEQMREQIQNLE